MADPNSAVQLYNALTELAYNETQLSITPRPPFEVADRVTLTQQATSVADCAAAFRQKNAAGISQQGLFSALALVRTALAMFASINNLVTCRLSKQEVLSAVAAAESAVQQL